MPPTRCLPSRDVTIETTKPARTCGMESRQAVTSSVPSWEKLAEDAKGPQWTGIVRTGKPSAHPAPHQAHPVPHHAANRKNGRPHHRGKQQQNRQKGGHGHHNARPQPHHAEHGKGEPSGLGNVTFLHRSGEPRRNAGNR